MSLAVERGLRAAPGGSSWGGKGDMLRRLAREGLPVPPTVAIPCEAIGAWSEALPGHARAIDAWRRWRGLDALKEFQKTIATAASPPGWAGLAEGIARDLGGGEVIFRSSMSLEDGEGESFAGCFSSVPARASDADDCWRAFREVVASAYREEAAARVLAAGGDPSKFLPGVIVQPLVQARAAGVLFTRDPSALWEGPGAALLEWADGQGEAVAQGSGGTRVARRRDGAPRELSEFWGELWAHAWRCEELVGRPCDVEWAWDGSRLWIVQARPIAGEEAALAARTRPGRRWTRALTLERFPEAMTPMGWSALGDAFESNLESLSRRFGIEARNPSEAAACVSGIVYSDPDFLSFPSGARIRWSRYLNPLRPEVRGVVRALLEALARIVKAGLSRRRIRMAGALLGLRAVRALLGPNAIAIRAGWDAHRERSLARLEEFGRSSGTVLARMEELRALSLEFLEPDLAIFVIREALARALERAWSACGYAESEFPALVSGFDGNRTLLMGREWETLAAALREDSGAERFLAELAQATGPEGGRSAASALGSGAASAWEGFLRSNGHCTTSWDVAIPSWRESPARLEPLLRSSLAGARRRQSRPSGPERERFLAEVARIGGARARTQVEEAITLLQDFMRMDEEQHFLSGVYLEPSRRLILEGGEALARSGALEAAPDAFFLEISELKRALGGDPPYLGLLARRRRARWERAKSSDAPADLPPPALAPPEAGDEWGGSPASPGVAEGIAVRITHIEEASRLAPGSILITASPNPALAPLYPLLGGLVTETGGPLSHGFVAAREYGLPAVTAVREATRRIPAGARVRLDGATGRIEVLP